MIAYIVERLFQSLLVLLIVAWAAFCMFQFVGDPVQHAVGQDTRPETVQRSCGRTLGLDDPVRRPVRALRGQPVDGNLGISLR